MNIEQLKQILDNAPEGATHVELESYGNEYWKLDNGELLWFASDLKSYEYQEVESNCMADFHSLSDIKQIVELSEQVEKLKEKYGDAFYDGFIAARDTERELTHGSISDYDDDAVMAISEQAESEVLQELTK